MKIQYASDLHLEFYDEKKCDSEFFERILTPVKDVHLLVLAGDIGYPEMQITRNFLAWCCIKWPHVVWIFGNHEYYGKYYENNLMMNQKETIAIQYMDDLPNLHVLHNGVFEHPDFPGFVIVGSTLWTEVPKDAERLVGKYMNDCRQIVTNEHKTFCVKDWNRLYSENVMFIKKELDRAEHSGKKALVVTHHLPTYKAILPEYQGHDLNCAFASNAAELLENPVVAAWICGHSHGQLDLKVLNRAAKDTLVTFNARGYPREESVYTYNPLKVLELL